MGVIRLPKTRIIAAFCVLLLAGLSSQHLNGQAATASIAGIITDSSGAVIAGAAINAKNNGTGITRTTVSDPRAATACPISPSAITTSKPR
jgi:hypothetical protein